MNLEKRLRLIEKAIADLQALVGSGGGGGGGTFDPAIMVTGEYHTGSTSTTITLSNAYVTNTVSVYKNNVRLRNNQFTQPTSTTIVLTTAPLSDDEFIIDYIQA